MKLLGYYEFSDIPKFPELHKHLRKDRACIREETKVLSVLPPHLAGNTTIEMLVENRTHYSVQVWRQRECHPNDLPQ